MKPFYKICTFAALLIVSTCAYFAYNSLVKYSENQKLSALRLKQDLEEAARYDSIPLRTKIGRMFIVSLDSCALKHDDPVIRKIKDYGVGGIILFGSNIPPHTEDSTSYERLAALCRQLQDMADYNLMIGIDQEGGRVRRLRTSNGYPELPSHAYLGRIDNEDTTRYYSGLTAEALKRLGINLNFAPCVDVNMNPECPVIGKVDRSFSTEPSEVGEHAGYYIEEHRRHGVMTAVKHFPGHGSSVTDSHNGLTDISLTWTSQELEPFRHLIENDCCDMIMVGHIFNNRLDPSYPASLSKATVDSLLRKELGWNGLVVSDDLGMKAIHDNYPLEESLRLCINSGVDMLMLIANDTPERLETAVSLIEHLVLTHQIPLQRINQSYRRIARTFSTSSSTFSTSSRT